MSAVVEFRGHLHARLRECWVLASNRRLSATSPLWTAEPTIHALAVETIRVDREHRRQGLCSAFLDELCRDPKFDMVIVEGVGNPILANALIGWGWDYDPVVMDFYRPRTP